MRKVIDYFFELLKDDNVTVRVLSWYVTLIPLIEIGLVKKEEIIPYYKWL